MSEDRKGCYVMHGPPGTGKTFWVSRQVEAAASKYGSDTILVASFTKAAAKVLVGRNLPIPDQAVGTLHAHCYRALGRPKIADAYIKEFAEAAGMLMSGSSIAPGLEEMTDRPAGTSQDDNSYLEYSRLRNLMVPREAWPDSVQHFGKLWEEWKTEHEMMDFTDLIEVACREMLYAPNNAQIGIVDEVQDCTPLQYKLIHSWGKSMRFFILAGDSDQSLYSFLGARPETMDDVGVPDSHKLFLRQSWRVPRQVQAYAERVIQHVARRQNKVYMPRDEEGSIDLRVPVKWKKPGQLVRLIENDLDAGLTVMVLAPCAYALGPTIKELKINSVPFANPYRVSRGDWNPLTLSEKRESSLGRLKDFLEPKHELRFDGDDRVSKIWSAKQVLAWTKLINRNEFFAKGFLAKIKAFVEDKAADTPMGMLELLMQYAISPEYISMMIRICSVGTKAEALGLIQANFSPAAQVRVESADYALRCLAKAGGDFEEVKPRLCIGTIHSIKGGQADSVYLIPDVPSNVYQATLHSRMEYDASVRLSYVAATRAKLKFAILAPESRFTLRGIF